MSSMHLSWLLIMAADVLAAENADVLAADTTDVLAADKYEACIKKTVVFLTFF